MTAKTSRPTIAIDIDDVIADSTESLRVLVNNRLGVDLRPEDYSVKGEYRGYYNRIWAGHGLSDRINMGQIFKEMEIDQSHVELIVGARDAINILAQKFDIVLITSRDTSWEPATKQWLDNHQMADRFSAVCFTQNYSNPGSKSKGQFCRELGASWLVDDNSEYCTSATSEGIKSVLFGDYGWQLPVSGDIARCKDWPAVLEFFDGYAE